MRFLDHQLAAMQRSIAVSGLQLLNHKTGTGKTLTTLGAFKYYKDMNGNVKMLVVCPINLIQGAWAKEIEKVNEAFGWKLQWDECPRWHAVLP